MHNKMQQKHVLRILNFETIVESIRLFKVFLKITINSKTT